MSMPAVTQHSLVIETTRSEGGRRLEALKPIDASGYFELVLQTIGIETQSGNFYDPAALLYHIESPEANFNKLLRSGYLFGEFGHPHVGMPPQPSDILRIVTVDPKCKSHHFRKVRLGATLKNGGRLLLGEVKPSGPYGQDFYNGLTDPDTNDSMSLRSLMTQKPNGAGRMVRYIDQLVTYDAVTAPGDAAACKRFSSGKPGQESLMSSILTKEGLVNLNYDITSALTKCFEIDEQKTALEGFLDNKLFTYYTSNRMQIERTKMDFIVRQDRVSQLLKDIDPGETTHEVISKAFKF